MCLKTIEISQLNNCIKLVLIKYLLNVMQWLPELYKLFDILKVDTKNKEFEVHLKYWLPILLR